MVRHFYKNLWLSRDEDYESWARPYVNGVEIFLISSLVNCMLGLVNGGFKVSSLKTMDWDLYAKLRDEAVAFLLNSKGEKVVNEITLTARTIGSVVTSFVQCRSGRDMTPFYHVLIYKIVKVHKIDFRHCFMYNLRQLLRIPMIIISFSEL